MENLPPDIQRQIALELKPSELIRLCTANKLLYGNICNDDGFWRLKLRKDFPERHEYFFRMRLPLKDPKKTYIREFTFVSNFLEKELSKLKLTPEEKEGVYKGLETAYHEDSWDLDKYIPGWDGLGKYLQNKLAYINSELRLRKERNQTFWKN